MPHGRPALGRWQGPYPGLALVSLAAALLWSAVLAIPHLSGEASPLDRIESALLDLRFVAAGPRPAPADVVIVALDDATVRAAGRYPIPRPAIARLIEKLGAARPRVIVVDVLFLDPGEAEADGLLASALADTPAVVAMAATFARAGEEPRASAGPFDGLAVAERFMRPADSLRVGRLGLVNVATDHGGTPRHIPLLVAGEGTLLPALSLVAAKQAAGGDLEFSRDAVRVGGVASPLDRGAALALRFYGPQGSVRTVSAQAVLADSAPADLSGRVLVIGATAFGAGDILPTPFDPMLPGVEVLATGIAHLLAGDALVRTTAIRRVDAALAFGLTALAVMLLSIRRVGSGLGLVVLAFAGFVAINVVLFAQGLWLSLTLPAAALLPVAGLHLVGRLHLDRRQRHRLERDRDALLRFHPPRLAAHLARDPSYLSQPVARDASVLFLDLSGFTGLSEQVGPARTHELLRDLHGRIEAIAAAHEGSVTSFMGDGAMILFGLPEGRDTDANRAAAAALDLAKNLLGWIADTPTLTRAGIGVRVGAHTGPVILSRLGSSDNQHITASGDTVNVTSRLLEIAKGLGVPIVLSGALLDAMRAPLQSLGFFLDARQEVSVRGRQGTFEICAIRTTDHAAVLEAVTDLGGEPILEDASPARLI